MKLPSKREYVTKHRLDECDVALVGLNPATDLDGYERVDKTNYDAYCNAYTQKRAGGKPSRTHQRKGASVDRLEKAGCKILEANLYPYATKNQDELQKLLKEYPELKNNHKALEATLASAPQLKAVIAHGKKARNWLRDAVATGRVTATPIYCDHYRVARNADIESCERAAIALSNGTP